MVFMICVRFDGVCIRVFHKDLNLSFWYIFVSILYCVYLLDASWVMRPIGHW